MNQKSKYPDNDPVSNFRMFQRVIYGDAIKDKATAIAISRILVESEFGAKELKRQEPFEIKDDGENWNVEGSFNKDRTAIPNGPVVVKLNKANATVISLYRCLVTPPRTP